MARCGRCDVALLALLLARGSLSAATSTASVEIEPGGVRPEYLHGIHHGRPPRSLAVPQRRLVRQEARRRAAAEAGRLEMALHAPPQEILSSVHDQVPGDDQGPPNLTGESAKLIGPPGLPGDSGEAGKDAKGKGPAGPKGASGPDGLKGAAGSSEKRYVSKGVQLGLFDIFLMNMVVISIVYCLLKRKVQELLDADEDGKEERGLVQVTFTNLDPSKVVEDLALQTLFYEAMQNVIVAELQNGIPPEAVNVQFELLGDGYLQVLMDFPGSGSTIQHSETISENLADYANSVAGIEEATNGDRIEVSDIAFS